MMKHAVCRFGGTFVLGTVGALGLLAASPPAAAAVEEVALASTTDYGELASGGSFGPTLSSDGRVVAFDSLARLDPADLDASYDVYVKDLDTGDITLVSTSDQGKDSDQAALSADGQVVAFRSLANLLPYDTDTQPDVYVRDLRTDELTLASTSSAGVKADNGASQPALSADGTTVAFQSRATNLDPADADPGFDIYVKDLGSGILTLGSAPVGGGTANGESQFPVLSADGTVLAFSSSATNLGPADRSSHGDIYVRDLDTGDLTLATSSDTGVQGNGIDSSLQPSLSDDGTLVAFQTNANNLEAADADGLRDVYVKNLTSGDLRLVSTSTAGVKGNRQSSEPRLSADGEAVAFSSAATNLHPQDADPVYDAYLKTLDTGELTLISATGSGTKANGSSFDPAPSANGDTIAFWSSATNLHPADTGAEFDIYVRTLPPTSPTISITDVTGFEGDTGMRQAAFRVVLSAPSEVPVTVDYLTADGTATRGSDYRAARGTITFAPGSTLRTVIVTVGGDTQVEPDETFTVRLTRAAGATVVSGGGVGTIRNDD